MISWVRLARRSDSLASWAAKRLTCTGSSAAWPRASPSRPIAPIGVFSSWLMFATKSRRTASSRYDSVRSSASSSMNRLPRRATRTERCRAASPSGPRDSSSSSVIGSSARRARSTTSTMRACTSVRFQTSPRVSARGDAVMTLLLGSSTTPADSSTWIICSTPSGTVVDATSAAMRPRRAASSTATTVPPPSSAPSARARGTSSAGSMATRLVTGDEPPECRKPSSRRRRREFTCGQESVHRRTARWQGLRRHPPTMKRT